jgi:class 3 adenylate cyclase
MRSRLAVIVVADIVGYTSMMAADEEQGIAAVREVNDRYVQPTTSLHEGEVLKRMGDGWIVAFGSVHAAIKGAIEVLSALSQHQTLKIRMGAHIGEIVEDEDDFYGAGVNLASRLQSEAPPGGMMISQDLFRQLTGDLAQKFESAGTFELKNIPYPVEGYQWRSKKSATPGEGDIPTLGVCKFEVAPANADTTSMADELRDQLIMNLSARTGIKTLDVDNVSSESLNYSLRGRLRKSGDQVRITISMVLCETGEALFSKNYQGDCSDFFAFADDMIVRVQLNSNDAKRHDHLDDDELSVSELRSRAAQHFHRGTFNDWQRAAEILDLALELSPEDPMANAMRAIASIFKSAARFEDISAEKFTDLETRLNNSIQAAPRSDFAYTVRALLFAYGKHDADAAIRDSKQALAFSPDYYLSLTSLGMGHMLNGDFEKAIPALERSLELIPDNPFRVAQIFPLAVCFYCKGDYQRCVEAVSTAIQLRPNVWALHKLKALALSASDNAGAAAQAEEKTNQLPRKPSIGALKPPIPSEFEDLTNQLAPEPAA